MPSCWVILNLFIACAFAVPVPAFINLPFRHAGPMRIDSLGRSQNGAVNKIILGPNRVAYTASVSGGVWRSDDITVDSPRWWPLTDDLVDTLHLILLISAGLQLLPRYYARRYEFRGDLCHLR